MKLVIDIDDNIYTRLFDNGVDDPDDPIDIATVINDTIDIQTAIRNGTPLPKGHGDLIDKDRLLDELEKTVKSVDDTNKHLLFWDRAVAHVHLSKPIIEADKGSDSK